MIKKLACLTAAIALLAISAAFGYFIFYIAQSTVLPAIQGGSLDIETSARVLNVLWEGNEVYALLAGYLFVAGATAYGSFRLFRAAAGGKNKLQ